MKAAILAVLFSSAVAQARIGYTLDQCKPLYGSVVEAVPVPAGTKWTFRKGDIQIEVTGHENGTMTAIRYSTLSGRLFTVAEAQQLLDKNGTDWRRTTIRCKAMTL